MDCGGAGRHVSCHSAAAGGPKLLAPGEKAGGGVIDWGGGAGAGPGGTPTGTGAGGTPVTPTPTPTQGAGAGRQWWAHPQTAR